MTQRWPCLDCRRCVARMGDWYMAQSEIWEDRLGLGWRDNLCLSCLEKRLGRTVKFPFDIYPASSFPPGFKHISDRLRQLFIPEKRGVAS